MTSTLARALTVSWNARPAKTLPSPRRSCSWQKRSKDRVTRSASLSPEPSMQPGCSTNDPFANDGVRQPARSSTPWR